MAPLEDPLLTDYAVHRWLDRAREETYSDWLAWTIANFESSEDVFDLFGIRRTRRIRSARNVWKVIREQSTERGHDGHAGRLDLHLVIPMRAAIQVEIKLGDADTADTAKQVGYRLTALTYRVPKNCRFAFLIAVAGKRDEYVGDYRLVRWSDVAIRLRRFAVQLIKSDRATKAALFLAFTGAIEQNILGYSSTTVRSVLAKELLTAPGEMVDYLRNALKRLNPYG